MGEFVSPWPLPGCDTRHLRLRVFLSGASSSESVALPGGQFPVRLLRGYSYLHGLCLVVIRVFFAREHYRPKPLGLPAAPSAVNYCWLCGILNISTGL